MGRDVAVKAVATGLGVRERCCSNGNEGSDEVTMAD